MDEKSFLLAKTAHQLVAEVGRNKELVEGTFAYIFSKMQDVLIEGRPLKTMEELNARLKILDEAINDFNLRFAKQQTPDEVQRKRFLKNRKDFDFEPIPETSIDLKIDGREVRIFLERNPDLGSLKISKDL